MLCKFQEQCRGHCCGNGSQGPSCSGGFGQSRDWDLEGLVVVSVASTLGEIGASGDMEYRSHLPWLLLLFCGFLLLELPASK